MTHYVFEEPAVQPDGVRSFDISPRRVWVEADDGEAAYRKYLAGDTIAEPDLPVGGYRIGYAYDEEITPEYFFVSLLIGIVAVVFFCWAMF